MVRAVFVVLVALPLVACNTTAQTDIDGAAFAVLPGAEQTEPAAGTRAGKRGTHADAGRYFVEFRSRYALSYGHTFLVHGRLNQKGEIGELTEKNVSGFHPAGLGSELWMVGHLVPVAAETGPSDGDLEEEYVSARFRVYLTEEQYRRFYAHLMEKKASNAMWHAATYNCNAWVGQIARYMGLKAPVNHLLYPADYINEMRRMNTGQQVAAAASTATAQ
jgi:hypothetical protein